MKAINKFASFLILASGLPALSAPLSIDCRQELQFCMEEFEEIVDQVSSEQDQPGIADIVKRLPVHVLRNVTFKRGNNMKKIRVGILGPHGHRVLESHSKSANPEKPRAFVWDEKTGFTASWNGGDKFIEIVEANGERKMVEQRAHDRMDLYFFDEKTNEHHLAAWSPNQGFSGAEDCTSCHGEVKRPIFPMYPDWPQFYGEFNDEMTGYPRGRKALRSDLREMANGTNRLNSGEREGGFQRQERGLFMNFLNNAGSTSPLYTPIFAAADGKAQSDHKVYPYRPDTTTSPFRTESRAFYHRPNLRLGIVYNRLTALQTFEKIKKSEIFKKFPDVMLYSMLDCNWSYIPRAGEPTREEVLTQVLDEARQLPGLEALTLRGVKFAANEVSEAELQADRRRAAINKEFYNVDGGFYRSPGIANRNYDQIPYEDLLKLLDLKIEDLDIRFKHNSKFKVKNGEHEYGIYKSKAFYHTGNAMDIGYTKRKYKLSPVCDNNGSACDFNYEGRYTRGMRYFNSYFDGSATMNELLAARMLIYLTDSRQNFSGPENENLSRVRDILNDRIPDTSIYFETLMSKYRRFNARLELDQPFFDKMDAIGPWIQTPYPPDLINIQNRESFWTRGATGTRLRHAQWTNLENRASPTGRNLNGGRYRRVGGKSILRGSKNICWNVFESLKRLKR